MKNPEKIRALEGLLARVQRNTALPRVTARHEVHDAPTVDRKQETPTPPRVAHDPTPVAAPAAAVAKAAPAAEPAKPAAEPAKPAAKVERHDEAPITRADPQSALIARESEELEELGPGDEQPLSSDKAKFADEETRPGDPIAAAALLKPPAAIVTGDELEVLDEEDVIDGSPAPAKVEPVAATPTPAPVRVGVVQSAPISAEIESAELIPEPPPPRAQLRSVPPPLPQQKTSDRPRSIPPPFPGVAKPPKAESLEADVPQVREARGPTVEQLGGTIELEEGPPADFELAPRAAPKAEEEPAENEAVLPRATSPGQFTAPRASGPIDEPVFDLSVPAAAPAPAAAPVVVTPKLEAPASPPPLAAPVALAAPATVEVSVSPDATARAVPSGEVAKFVAAAQRPSKSTFGELLDATLHLGTLDRLG